MEKRERPCGTHHRLSAEDYETMKIMYAEGKNGREIADRIGCRSTTVAWWRNKNGLPCQRAVIRRERRLNGLDRARIAMLELGMNSYYDYMAYKAKQEAGA